MQNVDGEKRFFDMRSSLLTSFTQQLTNHSIMILMIATIYTMMSIDIFRYNNYRLAIFSINFL